MSQGHVDGEHVAPGLSLALSGFEGPEQDEDASPEWRYKPLYLVSEGGHMCGRGCSVYCATLCVVLVGVPNSYNRDRKSSRDTFGTQHLWDTHLRHT